MKKYKNIGVYMYKMLFCCHRINTISELRNINMSTELRSSAIYPNAKDYSSYASCNNSYGIEIDLRDGPDGCIYLSHDPWPTPSCERLDKFLQYYHHSFLILNIKSEGIEPRVLEILARFPHITDYFFLDCSFPMIYRLSNDNLREHLAVRFSEFESIETVLAMSDRVGWVWVDCFRRQPLTRYIISKLKEAKVRICVVSPELQGRPEDISKYRNSLVSSCMYGNLDMICTKVANIPQWRHPKVQIVIPMSGAGKRFQDAGYTDPKPLIPVDGRPMIEHVVGLFPGESNIKFICNDHHLATTPMHKILQTIAPTCQIFSVPFDNRKGPVHAVSQIADAIDDELEVIVSYCDYGTYWNYDKFLEDARSSGADGAIACYRGFHPHMLGTDNYAFLREMEPQGSRWMAAIQEKRPFTTDRMSEYASNGTYYFKTGAIMKWYFQLLMDLGMTVNGEYYVSMVYGLMVEDGLRVRIHEIDHMLQWGTPYDLEVYQKWSEYFRNVMRPQPQFIDRLGTTLVLPMAGAGSRFSKVGYKDPKPLLDVNGAPMIIQAVRCLPATSQKVFICQQYHIEEYGIDRTLLDFWGDWTTKVHGIDGVTEGQACTCEIGLIKSRVGGDTPILISACDNGVYYDVAKYQAMVDDPTVDVIVWSFRNQPTSRNNPNMYAWMETDASDHVLSVSCKKFDPARHDLVKSHVIIGTMFFRKSRYFMEGLERNYAEKVRSNGEFYVDDVITQCVAAGLTVKVFEVENYICWGTPDDYETYRYWQRFFDKCGWHDYAKCKDLTRI